MSRGSAGAHPARSASSGRRRLAAALGAALIALSIAAPAALAKAPARPFGRGPALHRQVLGRTHMPSLAAAAAVAKQLPARGQPPRLPTLHSPTGASKGSVSTATAAPKPAVVVTPDVAAMTSLAGATKADGGGWTPADPWVAANSAYVVQVVNNLVRVTNRAGGLLNAVPNEVFFNVPPGHFASDGRIIWDATHGRWVGEVAWFAGDFSDDGFTLAVSDSSDPTAGWTLISIGFGGFLPDFPSIASSSDKIVIGDDIFDSLGAFQNADVSVFTWASILQGGVLSYNFCDDSGYMHPRAAQVLSAANDVHVIMEATDGSGDQWYFRVIGSGICNASTVQVVDGVDLTSTYLVPPFAAPPPPREVGADTIDNATDGRPTDAVWMAGHLYWTSTLPVSYDAGATWNDGVGYFGATTVASGIPTQASDSFVMPGDTIDAFIGGIGLSRNGTPIVTYSQSDAASNVAFYANRLDALWALGTPKLLDTGEAAITGERWGDYSGVATDPIGTGTVWATNMVAAADGSWRTDVVRLIVDNDVPTTPSAPSVSTLAPTNLTTAPKYRVAWGAATDANSGSVVYRLEVNLDSAGFTPAGTYTATSTTRSMYLGHTYQFRVTAVDPFGNAGASSTGPVLHPALGQNPTSKTGTWSSTSSTQYSGGSTWFASAAGATASYSTTSVRSLAIVTTKAPSRGSFKVYVDGVLKATISCYATTTTFRWVAYQVTWATPGTHTLKIVVVGTSGHPRVDVDGFLVLK